jgi:hypothetical protein
MDRCEVCHCSACICEELDNERVATDEVIAWEASRVDAACAELRPRLEVAA